MAATARGTKFPAGRCPLGGTLACAVGVGVALSGSVFLPGIAGFQGG